MRWKEAFIGMAAAGALLAAAIPGSEAVFMERPVPDGRLNPAQAVCVKVVSPKADEMLKDPRVEVRCELTNFDMQPGGPHLHYVLDNGPVREHFDPKAPIGLGSLSPGTYVLAVFAVTSWHESWKDSEAVAVVRFHVQEKSPVSADPSLPLLVFNMPQGLMERWQGRWVLFDFLVLNAEIASGDTRMQDCRVQYLVDGAKNTVEYQESKFWLNLKPGQHHIDVWLTDPSGNFLPNADWNWISRDFRVQ